MNRVLRIIIAVAIGFTFLKATTYGWRFSFKRQGEMQKDTQLADVLKSHVYKLSHEIGDRSVFEYENLSEAAGYITQAFSSFGYDVESQNYHVYDRQVENIIAEKKGTLMPDEIIIIGAHYDTCFNPGADDNASAVAGLLELARFISDKKTHRTVRFIAFVNEEPPFYKTDDMGSRVYAKAAKKAKEDIRAVVVLEMIGRYSDRPNSQQYPPFFGLFYPNKADFIAVVGNLRSRWLTKKITSSFKERVDFPIESISTFGFIPGVDFSDHWSFWKEGYPAVMVTDTAFYRSPDYHNESDTYEKLDYEKMAEVVKGLGAAIIELTG